MADSKIRVAILTYDIPKGQTKFYGKIRKAIGDICLMQTWSSYIFNWAFKDQLEKALEEINEGQSQRNRIDYRILLLDQAQSEQHEQMVLEALQRLLKNTSTLLASQLKKAKEAIQKAVAEGAKLEAATPEAEMGKARKVAVGGALKKLERAQRLAITFEANGMLETAFEAYKTLVETEAGLGESMEIAIGNTAFASFAGRVVD